MLLQLLSIVQRYLSVSIPSRNIEVTNKDHAVTIALGLCAATSLFAGALLIHKKRKCQRRQKNDEQKVTMSCQLADEDAFFYKFDLPPITTLTWFKGDFQAARPILQTRMKQIMAKNPWLQGRISRSSFLKGTYHLSYTITKTNREHDYNNINVEENFNVIDPNDSPLSREMPISTQNNALLRSDIYMSDIFLRNGPKEPFFKATLVPCATKSRETFALIVQMSHTAGDGATYYKLMHMLCCTTDANNADAESKSIIELIPERIQNSRESQIEAMGRVEYGYLTSIGFIGQNILGMIKKQWQGPLPYDYYIFNPDDIHNMEEAKKSHAKDAGLSFVSKNDVLTSWLMKNSTSDYGLMAINWRNRLAGHTDSHAGNYENFIFYDKEDYASPGLIRKSLKTYKRVVTNDRKFPSWWEFVNTECSIVTSWLTLAKPNVIEGFVEDLHFPLILAEAIPSHKIRMFVLFRAGVDKIGLCYPPSALSDGVDPHDPFRGITDFLRKKTKS